MNQGEMPKQHQDSSLATGFFVSRKRLYKEYVFDIRNDTNESTLNKRPGRRGPLTSSTVQNIDNVKNGGGACWRCKMLKKPVRINHLLQLSHEAN